VFSDQFRINEEVLELCTRGIHMITSMPQALSALEHAREVLEKGHRPKEIIDKELAHAEALSQLAQREISSDFSILHSRALVFLWNGLESLVKDILRDWAVNRPEILTSEPWASQRVKIGEYESLDVEQRAAYLVELVDQSVGGPMKQGINRLEKLLEAIHLNGSVEEERRRGLFELQQVRNVLVHRAGIADRRLCELCPSLHLEPGTRVEIDRKKYRKYADSVGGYLTELIFRTAEAFGVSDVRERTSRHIKVQSGATMTHNEEGRRES